MNNIAYIVCGNGFGHLNRSIRIVKYLLKKNINIDFFYPKKKYFRFIKKKQKKLNIIDFDTKITPEILKEKKINNLQWVKRLPNMKKYDLIVSDNLIDILELNLKTILIGNFLWFKSLPNLNNSWLNYQKSLLRKFKPHIICCKYFVPNYFSSNLKKIKVGLFTKFKNNNNDNSLLIYSGSNFFLQNFFKKLLKKGIFNKFPFKKIYLDEKIYSKKYSKKFYLFKYTKEHISQLSMCFGRPSMGIIHDCLSHTVPIISFYDKKDKEMSDNAKNLLKFNLGYDPKTFNNALKFMKILSKNNKLDKFSKICKKLEWNGDKHAANKIINYINNF